MNRMFVRFHRALAAPSEVIVVRADDEDIVCKSALARENGADVCGVGVFSAERDASRNRLPGRADASRLQIAIDGILKVGEVDPRLREQLLSGRSLHLDDGDAGRTLRT